MVRLGNQPSTNPVGTLAAGRLTRVSSIWSGLQLEKAICTLGYVLVPKTEASSSLEARQYVMEELTDDPSFMGEGGRFSRARLDWLVTGGRWSGRLVPKPYTMNSGNRRINSWNLRGTDTSASTNLRSKQPENSWIPSGRSWAGNTTVHLPETSIGPLAKTTTPVSCRLGSFRNSTSIFTNPISTM